MSAFIEGALETGHLAAVPRFRFSPALGLKIAAGLQTAQNVRQTPPFV
jgi:hypothetical protein